VWRRRLVGLALVAIAVGVVILRCEVFGDRAQARLEAALTLVVRGVEGDHAAFAEAERTLAGAASFTDPYPLFVLEVTRRLRERRWDDAAPEAQGVLDALSRGRWDDARARVHALPAELAGRAELARLVADLSAARLARP